MKWSQRRKPMSNAEKCDLIRRYILERKGVDIGHIIEPKTEREWELFNRAWMVAFAWFVNKGVA